MYRTSIFLLTLAIFATQAAAQSSTGSEITIQLSSAKPWVDTGVDLQSGDQVKITASPASQTSGACNPAGVSPAPATSDTLPLPTAASGALIARLHGQGSTPVLIGSERELKIDEASHLLLGMNFSGKPSCDGDMVVKVHKTAADSAAKETAQQGSRGQQLKSQLGTAAQVFMQGQFGLGKNESSGSSAVTPGSSAATNGTEPATALKTSDAPLDGDLRKKIDSLPRRVNDQFHNLGDMVNFVIVGSQKDVQAALDAATWHVADTSNTMAAINAAVQT